MTRSSLGAPGPALPPLVTTSVGGLPPLAALHEARLGHARGDVSDIDLARAAQDSTMHWIRIQEQLGIDVLVDPSPLRHDMVCRFTDALGGFAPGGLIRTYGNAFRRKPVLAGPVAWRAPITVAAWRELQALTSRPVKATLTGPYTLMAWSFLEYYDDRGAACLAIAGALRDELAELVAAGARVVQIDEPVLAERADEIPFAVDALHLLTEGVDAYLIAHTCREAAANGDPSALELPVDNVDLALTRVGDGAASLLARLPATLDLSLGVLAAHRSDVPAAEEIARRLRPVAFARSADTLWVTPDCRLERASPDVAEAQLAALVQAARLLRAELAPLPPEPTAVPIADA